MAILAATSATDVVSVLLAAAAFLLSVASFWMTSFRRPDVHVWGLISVEDLPGPYTQRNDLEIHSFLANSGASGPFVESLAIDDYREENDQAPIWSGFSGESRGIEKPIMLDRFEAQHVTFARGLQLNTV